MFGVQRIGRYEVLGHLASGGMGQVYLARVTGLGGFERQVVIKALDLSVADDDAAFVTMFLDEARLVGTLHHQYIAPVYEVGLDDEGHYYLVMDYVHGETAEAVFRVASQRHEPLPLAFSLTVGSCIASALDYAHTLCAADGTPLEIVHRDVSLSNVMIGHDGAVKLIDFGIAKAANRATKTQVGILKGKIGYLAPEQILRQPVDHRADIFALGIVLYELTTGERAFRDTSDLVTLERIADGDVRPPRDVIAGYPVELERIVMKALRVEPERRFQDAGALGRQLEALAARMGLPLGHAAVIDVMSRLFHERRGRRRMARGSNEAKTDPTVAALPVRDEPTPATREDTFDAVTVEVSRSRRAFGVSFRDHRPTTPMLESGQPPRPDVPLEVATPLAGVGRTTRLGTGPQRPPRVATGPMQPLPADEAPTEIAVASGRSSGDHALADVSVDSGLADREDPTDVSGAAPSPLRSPWASPAAIATTIVRAIPRRHDTAAWLLGLTLLGVAAAVAVLLAAP